MPFTPGEFLDVGRQVATTGSEAALRTAVNRAYYAVAITAWLLLSPPGRARRRVDHKLIEKSAKTGGRTLGDQYSNLLRLRAEADYYVDASQPGFSDWNENWSRAEAIARVLLPKVRQFRLPSR